MPDSLNPAQLDAVHYLRGPSLVLAGAGSGKTRVIITKIQRLLNAGLKPSEIAAITFTNKAADEMRARTKTLVGGKAAKPLVICTFHALGVNILRQDGHRLGLKPQFSILDSDDVLSLLKDAASTTDAAQAKRWQWAISAWKNQGLGSADALALAKDENERTAAQLFRHYEERLLAYQSVDFDDLIALPLKLLQQHEEARQQWQERFKHVLVDEYQDTNAIQYELLKALVGAPALFTAVGDDDQSIYGWRGADLNNLKKLSVDFPQLKLIKLEQNYRSTTAILRAANHVIAQNPKLFEKTLWSEMGEGEPIRLLECDTEEHEAERTVQRMQAIQATQPQVQWRDFAVLYRANHQAKVFEQALRRANIPYKVSGGQSFFDRAEIKDLCAWLRLLVNNDDDPAFLRAVTTPKRGIGHQSLSQLGQFAGQWKVSLFEALFSPSLSTQITARALENLQEFGRQINDLEYRARQAIGGEAARALMMDLLKRISYEQHLHDTADSDKLATQRWSNVLELVDWMARRCEGDGPQEHSSLLDTAQTISLISSMNERQQEQNVVTLSTLHAAKGLEWPHVVLAGVVEGTLPFLREGEEMDAQRLEEERRLMYVGITRARQTLAVSSPRRRKKGRETVATRPSRFIEEMKLHDTPVRADPRARLKELQLEMKKKGEAHRQLGSLG